MKKLQNFFALLLIALLFGCPQNPVTIGDPDPIVNTELSAEDKAVILTKIIASSYNSYTSAYPDLNPVPGNPSGTMAYTVDNGTTPATITLTYVDFNISVDQILYLISGIANIQSSFTAPSASTTRRDLVFTGDLQITASNDMTCGPFSLSYVRINDLTLSTYTEEITGTFAGTGITYSVSGTISGG